MYQPMVYIHNPSSLRETCLPIVQASSLILFSFQSYIGHWKVLYYAFFLLEWNKVQEKRGLNKVSIKRQTGKAWQDNRHRYRHKYKHKHKHKHKPSLCTQG